MQEAVFSAHSGETFRESESYCQLKETVRTPEAHGRSEIRTEGMTTPIRSDVTHGRPCGAKRTRSLVRRPHKRRSSPTSDTHAREHSVELRRTARDHACSLETRVHSTRSLSHVLHPPRPTSLGPLERMIWSEATHRRPCGTE